MDHRFQSPPGSLSLVLRVNPKPVLDPFFIILKSMTCGVIHDILRYGLIVLSFKDKTSSFFVLLKAVCILSKIFLPHPNIGYSVKNRY